MAQSFPLLFTSSSSRQILCSGHDSTLFFYDDSVEGDSYTFEVDGVEAVPAIAPYKQARDSHVTTPLFFSPSPLHQQGEQYLVAIATKEHTVVAYSYLPGNPNDDPFANVR